MEKNTDYHIGSSGSQSPEHYRPADQNDVNKFEVSSSQTWRHVSKLTCLVRRPVEAP